jgi:hypothetical protein
VASRESRASGAERGPTGRQSLDYLRQRSLHRLWWSSARIALRRVRSGEPPHPPKGAIAHGKRV